MHGYLHVFLSHGGHNGFATNNRNILWEKPKENNATIHFSIVASIIYLIPGFVISTYWILYALAYVTDLFCIIFFFVWFSNFTAEIFGSEIKMKNAISYFCWTGLFITGRTLEIEWKASTERKRNSVLKVFHKSHKFYHLLIKLVAIIRIFFSFILMQFLEL